MRHAAPRRRGKTAARLLAAAIVYGVSLLVTGITIVGTLGVWALWGVLGVR